MRIPRLTQNETTVYKELLNLKEAGATKISSRTGLFRTLVYDVLTKLAEKGLVSYIKKDGKRVYRPSSPEKLLDIIKEEERETERLIPELKTLFNEEREDVLVEQYEGQNGMKTIIEDMFKDILSGVAKEVYFLGPTGESWNFMEAYLKHSVSKIKQFRILRKIDFKVIWSSKKTREDIAKMVGGAKHNKTLPEGFNPTVPFIVYGDKFAINGGEKKPFSILIKNSATANSFKDYFRFIWENTK